LIYYIRKNTRPEKRVALQLAVKAGSVDETDEQQGLAHFLEHMAFNGSRHYKPGELIATFESTGARLGPHVNAYTSFDETVYQFQLPTDKDGIVLKGLQALSDFAGGMTLDPKEIDKERGVVIEEWRGGLGADSRLRDQQIPVLFYKSKYAERLPIGKPDVLKSFTPDRLRDFYTKWYRPDRMALVVVGDVDVAQIEAMVKSEFGGLTTPATPPPDRAYEVPLQSELLVKVATDPEAARASVSIVRKRKRPSQDRVADYRRGLVHGLVAQMINERFDELSRKPEAQFLGAGAYESGLSPAVSTFTMSAGIEEGKLAAGLATLAVEANRVRKYGFGAAELDRAVKSTLAAYDRAYQERDKTESGSYAQEYVSHFLEGEPSPGIEVEYQLAKTMIPAIAASEVGDAARAMFADDSRVILAVSPQKPGVAVPTEAELRDALTKADAVAVTPWRDTTTATTLLERVPEAAAVMSRREVPELGVTIVRFANGVEAWLKPTDFKNDQVLFSLVASGGASLAPAEVYPEASLSTAQIELSGAGGHSAVDMQKLLAGKIASASPFVRLSSHGISGSSTPANLETALQLLHLNLTAPGDDPQAFALIRRQLEAAYANRDRNPGALFGEKLAEVNSSGHYTARPLTLERIAKLDRAAMVAFYKERFANAADFTFFMVGAFKVDAAVPLLARYVGSLASTGQAASRFKDVGMKFPSTVERATVSKGTEPRAQTVLSFFADPPIDENEQTRIEAATEVLEIALRDILREELGETYGVSVGLQQPLPQRGDGYVAISFGASPANIGKMVDRVMAEVRRLQQEGPSADLTSRAKQSALREHETALKQNGFWLGRLQSAKLLDRDPLLILQRERRIDAVTPANVQEMFRTYFPADRYTIVTLLPEK
jgi:zinc protease